MAKYFTTKNIFNKFFHILSDREVTPPLTFAHTESLRCLRGHDRAKQGCKFQKNLKTKFGHL